MIQLFKKHREMQQTSLEAYDQLDNLGERQKQVYDWLRYNQPATNTMISKGTGIAINVVTPRVFELREMKRVGVSHEAICLITKRKAIYWRVVK